MLSAREQVLSRATLAEPSILLILGASTKMRSQVHVTCFKGCLCYFYSLELGYATNEVWI